jgi:hypothetical protein
MKPIYQVLPMGYNIFLGVRERSGGPVGCSGRGAVIVQRKPRPARMEYNGAAQTGTKRNRPARKRTGRPVGMKRERACKTAAGHPLFSELVAPFGHEEDRENDHNEKSGKTHIVR